MRLNRLGVSAAYSEQLAGCCSLPGCCEADVAGRL